MGITGHGDESTRAGPLCPFLPYFPFPDPLFCPTDPALQIYPSEIPEEQLKLLGPLSRQYTAEEISRWPVTSSNTLSALLDPSDGKWEASQVNPRQQGGTGAGEPKLGPLGAQAELGVKVLPKWHSGFTVYAFLPGASSFPACVQLRELCFPGPAAAQQVPGPGGHLDRALASENRWEKPVQSAGGADQSNTSSGNQVRHFLGMLFSPTRPLGSQAKQMVGWQTPTSFSALPARRQHGGMATSHSQLLPEWVPPAPWAGTDRSSPPTNKRALAVVWGGGCPRL